MNAFFMPDEEYFKMNVLQDLALFYREPSGVGSQGGYDCLLGGIASGTRQHYLTEEEQKIWQSHWDYCNNLPDRVKGYIMGHYSLKELGEVTDVDPKYLLNIKDVPV